MEEYVIKLTQTEAEALTYAIGCQKGLTPILSSMVFEFLEKEVFIKNDIEYRHNVRNNNYTTLEFIGF
jgi:hypothetical protein